MFAGKAIGPFGLREREWIQHVGVFGRSGAGKTNAGYLTLRELFRHGKPFLVFDWKRNYRDLIAKPEFDDIEIYTIGRPIAPPGKTPLPPQSSPSAKNHDPSDKPPASTTTNATADEKKPSRNKTIEAATAHHSYFAAFFAAETTTPHSCATDCCHHTVAFSARLKHQTRGWRRKSCHCLGRRAPRA